MWQVLTEYPSLAFYNAGPIAGASQPHKHLQVVSADYENNGVPFHQVIHSHIEKHEHVSKAIGDPSNLPMVDALPFLHGVNAVNDIAEAAAKGEFQLAGELSMQKYTQLIADLENQIQLSGTNGGEGQEQDHHQRPTSNDSECDVSVRPFSYNFLCNRHWMMLIPRRKECFERISVNALGFAGYLLVKDTKSLNTIKQRGGMAVIREVTFPKPS